MPSIRFKATQDLGEMPENGITITELVEQLGIQRETIRSLLDRRKIQPLGFVRTHIAKSNVYDKTDIAFVYEYEFKPTIKEVECSINSERKAFLSTPMIEGVIWNNCK